MTKRLRAALTSRRGLGKLFVHALAMFGGLSGLFQFYSAVFVPQESIEGAGWITVAVVLLSLGWGVSRALPKRQLSVGLANPEITVEIRVADIFDLNSNIVVGFCDTFDTDTTMDRIISTRSVQGQLLQRLYGDNVPRLDADLAQALGAAEPEEYETSNTKSEGKLARYAIGTVAELHNNNRRIFCVAYTRMGNDLRAQATVDGLWHALTCVWKAVASSAQLRPVALPIVGSELARISSLDRNNLIQLIVMSFVAAARADSVSRSLTIVVHPSDEEKLNMLELEAFLKGF